MRSFGALQPTSLIPVPPDTVGAAVVSSAGAVVALDYPTDADGKVPGIVCIGSTAGCWVDMESTGVAIPSASSKGTTSSRNEFIPPGTYYQIPGSSTGLSITANSAAKVSLSYWRKG